MLYNPGQTMYKYYIFTCLVASCVGLWVLVRSLSLMGHPHTTGFVAFIAAVISIGTMCYGFVATKDNNNSK